MPAKKWILRSVIAVVALLLIAVVILYFSLDAIVRSGVERGATQSTGQPTSLDSAKVSLTAGTLELSGLAVNNPPGFSSNKVLSMHDAKGSAQISSLFTNDVVIPEIDIDGLEVLLEQNGLNSNLSEILNHSKQSTPAAGGASAPTPPGRNIHVGLIKLSNTKVHLATLGQSMTLDLGPIEIKDPTNPDGRPMKIADVVSKILIHVADQIAQNPQIPEAVRGSITQVQGIVSDLQNMTKDGGKNAATQVQDLSKDLGNLLNQKKKK
ncbi:MAG: DUF748 domain-containing protein [Phycisphaerae bacterium]